MSDLVLELKDLRHLNWAQHKLSPGTPGCFLKAYEEEEGTRYYYKLSNYDSYRGVFGHECVNELIVSRFLDVLQVEHLAYQLVHARVEIDGTERETYITKSVSFRRENERKIPLDTYYELHRQSAAESPLDFMIRMGWTAYTYQMMLVDYFICNRDRHGANIEILIDESGAARPAPLFDQGVSLLYSCYDDPGAVRKFDVMEDRPVNNFIGSRSLEYNLQLVPRSGHWFDGALQKTDREKLLDGLDVILPKELLDKVWDMLWRRWNRYAELLDTKSEL